MTKQFFEFMTGLMVDIDGAKGMVPVFPSSAPDQGVLRGLAGLDPKTMLDQDTLAERLGVSSRTIRRMVKRFEIPPPIRLNTRSVWFVGKVLEHLEARAKVAQDKADKEAKKYKTDFY